MFDIHKSSVVDFPCHIGKGTKIWHFCHISKGAEIGSGCKLGQNVFVDTGVKIGNNVKVQNNVSVYRGVTLEDDVFCGPSMVFTNVMNPRSAFPRSADEFRRTTVCRGATIGANATIVCGHGIGKYAFIGAGSVVTKDIPGYAMAYGNPARIRGWMCECGCKLAFREGTAKCDCGRKYSKKGNKVTPK